LTCRTLADVAHTGDDTTSVSSAYAYLTLGPGDDGRGRSFFLFDFPLLLKRLTGFRLSDDGNDVSTLKPLKRTFDFDEPFILRYIYVCAK
jgi:hypothetical protein